MSASEFKVVIPARFASTRFPGKALADLAGRPLLEHVWRRACASAAAEVVVATDDQRIAEAAQAFGADVIMTRADHESGTDRIAEVAELRAWDGQDCIINVQGDAPLIPLASINLVAALLKQNPQAAIATLCTPITDIEAYRSPNVVKVVCDQQGRALYFSRSPIPAVGHGNDAILPDAYRHLGIYGYRVGALRTLTATPPCYLERIEKLEQLRALWLGMEIRVGLAQEAHGPDVDTPEDLAEAAQYFAAD